MPIDSPSCESVGDNSPDPHSRICPAATSQATAAAIETRVSGTPALDNMDIARKPDPAGDRVVVTLNGKFLPYKTY